MSLIKKETITCKKRQAIYVIYAKGRKLTSNPFAGIVFTLNASMNGVKDTIDVLDAPIITSNKSRSIAQSVTRVTSSYKWITISS
jgi:hypothetical protein